MTIRYYGLDRGANQQPEAIIVGTSNALSTATTADTDAGTVVSANTTVLSAIDTFAAAVIAITGDTYAAHQFGGAAGTGLTAAQVNTLFHGASGLNSAITDFLTAQTDANTAKAATAAALAAAAIPADITLDIDLSKSLTTQDIILALQAFERRLENGDYGPKDIGNI
jgi:hypothetical protein